MELLGDHLEITTHASRELCPVTREACDCPGACARLEAKAGCPADVRSVSP